MALKSVDFPTFGNPTKPHVNPMSFDFRSLICRILKIGKKCASSQNKHQIPLNTAFGSVTVLIGPVWRFQLERVYLHRKVCQASQPLLKESSMKKILLVALAILVIGSVSYGQDVVSNLAANNFSGGFGAKYYLSSSMAVRGVLQFSSAATTTPANPGAGQVGVDGETSNTTIGVGGAVELHMGSGRVSPYLGGGVGFSTTSTESKNPATATPPAVPAQTTVKNNNAPTTFTMYAMSGFEFFLWKEASPDR